MNYDGLWEIKKFPDEVRRLDWIALIDRHRSVIND